MEQDKIQEELTKIRESQINTEKQMIRFEVAQLKNSDDISDLKTNVKGIVDTVGTIKIAEAGQSAVEAYIKYNKQTLSRPLLVGIIVTSFSLLLGLFVVFINVKSTEALNKTAQSMIDAVKTINGGNP